VTTYATAAAFKQALETRLRSASPRGTDFALLAGVREIDPSHLRAALAQSTVWFETVRATEATP